MGLVGGRGDCRGDGDRDRLGAMSHLPCSSISGGKSITLRSSIRAGGFRMRRASSDWREWSDPIAEDWFVDMARRNLGELTIRKRRHNLARLAIDVGRPLASITSTDIDGFLDARQIDPHSRAHWLSNLNCFYVWAVRNERLEVNPVARLTRPRLGRYLPNPIPEHELERALSTATPLMRSWLILMAYAGLRVSEVANLCGDDVDRSSGMLRVLGKGDKVREIPMHPLVLDVLASVAASGVLFVRAEDGAPWTPAEVGLAVGRHLRRSGSRRTAHKLRHRFATVLLEAGAGIEVVAELMGHESIETTRGYGAVSLRRKRAALNLI